MIRQMVLMGLLVSGSAFAQIPDWFDPNESTAENAAGAKDDGASAADATRGLIAAGEDPAHSVQAVIQAYNTCDAVYDSVKAAADTDGERAGDLVQAASASGSCPCTGENIWAAARLEERVRLEHRRIPVEIFSMCGCSGAAAQAAATAVPEQADRILAAALNANRRPGGVVDSLGQIGSNRGPVGAEGGVLTRRPGEECTQDADPDDAFDATAVWQPGSVDPASIPATLARNCDSDEDDTERSGELQVDQFVADGANRALVLHNGTRDTIDLAGENYQFELYFPGEKQAGRRISLTGEVPPNGLFVVSSEESSADWKRRANLVVPSVLMQPAEAVVLRRGLNDSGCDCARVTVAGTMNGLGADSERWREEQKEEQQGEIQLRNADSIGQVRPESYDRSQWVPPLGAVPQTLARIDSACLNDADVADDFANAATYWSAGDGRGGNFNPDCSAMSNDVLIAEYAAVPVPDSDENWRMVELFNNTGAPVDLGEQGYVLEVYAAGEREPQSSTVLKGNVDNGGRYLVTTDRAPSALKDQARLIANELAVPKVDAVVLRRLAVRTGNQCQVEVAAALRTLPRAPIPLQPTNPRPITGNPDPEDLPIDPDRGGEIASPN